ncbi:hypothetical protein A6C57_00285 [Fibrella sp. ES10-3-2-2]|nr:hypothetical protein A6C57_00285 [Fibrella sp. ES10-3-2-2]
MAATNTTGQTPSRFRFDRRTIGILELAKTVLESTALGSATTTALTGELDTIGIMTAVLIVLRLTISRLLSMTVETNPIE